jgi:hypothetical protein
MKMTRRTLLISLAFVATVIPRSALSAGPSTSQDTKHFRVTDVTLQKGDVLQGQLVDSQGLARPGSRVWVYQQDQLIASATSDTNGRFTINHLNGGVYMVQTQTSGRIYRIWAPGTAPPAAQNRVVLETGAIVRGQSAWDHHPGVGQHWFSSGTCQILSLGLGITGTTLGVIALADDKEAS